MEYRITAPELNQLEKSLSQLKIINEKSQNKLMLLKDELKLSKSKLIKAKNESKLLKLELATLK